MCAVSRAPAEAVIAEDPFYLARMAEYETTQFFPAQPPSI